MKCISQGYAIEEEHMAKIVIVEDDEVIRQELALLLRNAGYETEIITNLYEISKQITQLGADLVLLDVMLPEESGLKICGELRKDSQIPIIFVTANNTSMDELNCILQGGDDYIAKPYQAPVLLARIGAVLRRTKPVGEEEHCITCHQVTLDMASGSLSYQGQQIELTKNEWKILTYLFRHQGQIVSRAELIDFLWDNQVFIDDNTLSVNMTRIRSHLMELGVVDFIITKRGMGYLIP